MSMLFLLPLWTIGAAIVDGTHEHKKNRARMKAWQKKTFGGRHG